MYCKLFFTYLAHSLIITLRTQPKIDIYGPAGLRMLLRTTLGLTHTHSAEAYAVHELLLPTDISTPCEPVDILHSSEIAGRDLQYNDDGFWRNVTTGRSSRGHVCLHTGPIIHRGMFSTSPSYLKCCRRIPPQTRASAIYSMSHCCCPIHVN